MKLPLKSSRAAAALLLTLSPAQPPCPAQRQAGTQAKRPRAQAAKPATGAPAQTPAEPPQGAGAARARGAEGGDPDLSLDDVLSADAYAVYGELRMVGQLISAPEVRELLATARLPGGAPPELLALADFLNSHAETLSTSRALFATAPVREQLPDTIIVAELPSVEQARKLVPELRAFLSSQAGSRLLAPPAAATTAGTTTTITTTVRSDEQAVSPSERRRARLRAQAQGAQAVPAAAAAAPFHLKQAGRLVAFSDSPFAFKNLRRAGERALAEEQGFAMARTRLAREQLFVYVNTTRMSQNVRRRQEEYQRRMEEAERQNEAEVRRQRARAGVNANTAGLEAAEGAPTQRRNMNGNVAVLGGAPVVVGEEDGPPAPPPAVLLEGPPAQEEQGTEAAKSEKKEETQEERRVREQREQTARLMGGIGRVVFGGAADAGAWPESIGVGAGFEGDALVLRAVFLSDSPDRPARPVPFVPALVSGPPVTPEAASVLPADTDILVTASLDLPQMYDYVASMLKFLDLAAGAGADGKAGAPGGFEAQLGAFERANNFRIKEDLLASLGSELAVGLPGQWFGGRRARRAQKPADGPSVPPAPVFVVALNDKEAFRKLLPRVLEGFGLKGAGEQGLFEKRGQVEVLGLGMGSFALVDRYLIIAPDPQTMRRVADAYNEGRTLANTEGYREAVAWQPRQSAGQVYVANEMLRGLFADTLAGIEDVDDEALRRHLGRLEPDPGAITHALTREADGLVHELHLPKNFIALFNAMSVVQTKLAPLRGNEGMAMGRLYTIARAQQEYKQKHGRYGALEDLRPASEYMRHLPAEATGYEIKLNVAGDGFSVTATPTEYRKTGRRSFYLDQTGVMRGGDLKGRTATASDEPINY